MPLQSVRPDIIREWTGELLAWDGDPSTVDALALRLAQIAAGHGVSLDHYRQAQDPAADWTAPRQRAEPPDLTALRESMREARERRSSPPAQQPAPTDEDER